MKALTICQPYAELIARGDKLVENRTWPTSYRGELLIHAGKGRKFLGGDNYGIQIDSMDFGKVIAVASLAACVQWPNRNLPSWLNWMSEHEHAEGPWCWVLNNVRRLQEPISYTGAQGIFNVPNELLTELNLEPAP